MPEPPRQQLRDVAEWVARYGGNPANFAELCHWLDVLHNVGHSIDPRTIEPAVRGDHASEYVQDIARQHIADALAELLGELPYSGHAPQARELEDVPTGGLL